MCDIQRQFRSDLKTKRCSFSQAVRRAFKTCLAKSKRKIGNLLLLLHDRTEDK